MAELTPPTTAYLGTFAGTTYSGSQQTAAAALLTQATDAVWVYTGLDAYPSDERMTRIIKNAICELALWISAQADARDIINSPVMSERIGSYSYSKMMGAAKAGQETGLFWIDLLFQMLRAPGTDGSDSWVSSERVFNPEGLTFQEMDALERLENQDPAYGWKFF